MTFKIAWSRIGKNETLSCYDCKRYLPKEDFGNENRPPHFKKTLCKKCDYKRSREYLKSKPDKVKEYRKRHRKHRLKLKRETAEYERETLHGNYIRRLLARYSSRAESEFTDQEVEDKRNLILKHRNNGGFECWTSEMAVRKTLEIIFPGFKFSSREPKWNINPETGYRMEIDCYNKELGLAVEYNGKQHYELVEYFQDQDSFEAQRQRDIEKQRNCDSHGIRLIVVPYWVEDYDGYLREQLFNLNSEARL